MKNLKLTLILTAFAVLFTSCKKETITGPKGEQGISGMNGSNGADGQDGNANVVGTNEFTITAANWTSSGTSWICILNVPSVTPDVASKGIVQVYMRYGSAWWAMPDVVGMNQTTFGFSAGSVTIFNTNMNGTTSPNPGSKTIRIVAISPSHIKENPNTNWNNYEETMRTLNRY